MPLPEARADEIAEAGEAGATDTPTIEAPAERTDDKAPEDDAGEVPAAAPGSLMAAATVAQAAAGTIGDDLDESELDTEAAASALLSSANDHDIDVLSRRIWSRIRREMRSELLIDRERAGVLADHR